MMSHKHKTKKLIEETAISLLSQSSLHGFGVNELIEKCEIAKGTLYFHFPQGKTQIIKDALLNAQKERINEVDEDYIPGSSLGHALQKICEDLAKILEKNNYSTCSPVTRIAVEATAENEEIREICCNILNTRRNFHVRKLIECGFEQHEAEINAQFIVCSIEGGILLSRAHQTKRPLHQTGIILRNIYLKYMIN